MNTKQTPECRGGRTGAGFGFWVLVPGRSRKLNELVRWMLLLVLSFPAVGGGGCSVTLWFKVSVRKRSSSNNDWLVKKQVRRVRGELGHMFT